MHILSTCLHNRITTCVFEHSNVRMKRFIRLRSSNAERTVILKAGDSCIYIQNIYTYIYLHKYYIHIYLHTRIYLLQTYSHTTVPHFLQWCMTHICTYIIYIHIHIHTHIYTHICTRINIYTHIYIYIYIHYIHIYIHPLYILHKMIYRIHLLVTHDCPAFPTVVLSPREKVKPRMAQRALILVIILLF